MKSSPSNEAPKIAAAGAATSTSLPATALKAADIRDLLGLRAWPPPPSASPPRYRSLQGSRCSRTEAQSPG